MCRAAYLKKVADAPSVVLINERVASQFQSTLFQKIQTEFNSP